MRARRLQFAVAAVAAAGLLAASAPTSGAAGSSGTGSAYSAAAKAGTVSSIAPTCKLVTVISCTSGVLGLILGPVVSSLVSDIQSIPNTIVTALTGAGLSASQPATQLARPNPQANASTGQPNFPTCGQQGWDASGTGDCYTGVPVTIPATAVLGLNVSGVSGYATDDTAGYVGAAQAAGVSLSLLGSSLGSLSTVWAMAQCANSTTSPNCQATNSTATASLLPISGYPSGALQAKISGTGGQVLSLNGAALSGTNNTVTVPGVGKVVVALNGNLLTLTITLVPSLITSLLPTLNALGLVSLKSDSGTLTLAIGPGSTSTTSGATASGLTISADLSLDVQLSLLGIGLVDVSTGSGISSPDLLNLSLAYSSATAGTAAASWVGTGLI